MHNQQMHLLIAKAIAAIGEVIVVEIIAVVVVVVVEVVI